MRGEFFRCDCTDHGIYVESPDWDDRGWVYVELFTRKPQGPPSLKWRLGNAYRALHLWAQGPVMIDDLHFSLAEAKRLGEHLVRIATEDEEGSS